MRFSVLCLNNVTTLNDYQKIERAPLPINSQYEDKLRGQL